VEKNSEELLSCLSYEIVKEMAPAGPKLTPTEMEKSRLNEQRMKGGIGVVLVLLILFLPMMVSAEETTRVYSMEELEAFEREGGQISVMISYIEIGKYSFTAGKNALIDGNVQVNIRKRDVEGIERLLYGFVHSFQMNAYIYREGVLVHSTTLVSDEKGRYEITDFIPREPGYYELVLKDFYKKEWLPLNYNITTSFYVYGGTSPTPSATPSYNPYTSAPAFEAIFAIAGLLLAVALLFRRRR
jgi:hypothetical protein